MFSGACGRCCDLPRDGRALRFRAIVLFPTNGRKRCEFPSGDHVVFGRFRALVGVVAIYREVVALAITCKCFTFLRKGSKWYDFPLGDRIVFEGFRVFVCDLILPLVRFFGGYCFLAVVARCNVR